MLAVVGLLLLSLAAVGLLLLSLAAVGLLLLSSVLLLTQRYPAHALCSGVNPAAL